MPSCLSCLPAAGAAGVPSAGAAGVSGAPTGGVASASGTPSTAIPVNAPPAAAPALGAVAQGLGAGNSTAIANALSQAVASSTGNAT